MTGQVLTCSARHDRTFLVDIGDGAGSGKAFLLNKFSWIGNEFRQTFYSKSRIFEQELNFPNLPTAEPKGRVMGVGCRAKRAKSTYENGQKKKRGEDGDVISHCRLRKYIYIFFTSVAIWSYSKRAQGSSRPPTCWCSPCPRKVKPVIFMHFSSKVRRRRDFFQG